MAILNGNITLNEFNTSFAYNKRQPKDFFRGHRADSRDLLPVGTLLWKCTDHGIDPAHKITEWWIQGDHLTEVLQRCLRLGISLRRYCRARYAVIWEWRSAAQYVLRARLVEPVFAFTGQVQPVGTRFTPRGQDTGISNLMLIGGDPQLCIPNLTSVCITQLSLTNSETLPAGWQTQGPPTPPRHPPLTAVRGGRS